MLTRRAAFAVGPGICSSLITIFGAADLLIRASLPTGMQLAGMKTKLGQWLLYRLGSYEKAFALAARSLDRKLSFRERITLSLHMELCAFDPRYRDELIAIKQILRLQFNDIKNLDAEHLSDETRERIKQMLKNARCGGENGTGSHDK